MAGAADANCSSPSGALDGAQKETDAAGGSNAHADAESGALEGACALGATRADAEPTEPTALQTAETASGALEPLPLPVPLPSTLAPPARPELITHPEPPVAAKAPPDAAETLPAAAPTPTPTATAMQRLLWPPADQSTRWHAALQYVATLQRAHDSLAPLPPHA